MKTWTKEEFHQELASKKRILVISGAGASAESGIATFRGSASSWWTNPFGMPILALFGTAQGWRALPWFCWTVVNRFFRIPAMHAQPNACHRFLGEVSKKKWVRIITQNVDGLHQKGGSSLEQVAEIHGSIWRMRCNARNRYNADRRIVSLMEPTADASCIASYEWPSHTNGACPECGGWCARPDVTLFGEGCPYDDMRRAASFMDEMTMQFGSQEDIVLLIGTSGMVSTIFEFIGQAQAANKTIVLIDPNPSEKMLQFVNVVVKEKAGVLFDL